MEADGFGPAMAFPRIVVNAKVYPEVTGKYCLKCSFNLTFRDEPEGKPGWTSRYHYGINLGAIVLMVENHRSGLVWRLMRHVLDDDFVGALFDELRGTGSEVKISFASLIRLVNAADYRDSYANSIQIRVSVWDFLLVFGRLQPLNAQDVEVQNFQGIYLSPQQAKALLTILEQNVRQYEGTFGEIKLDPSITAQQGQIN